MPLLDRARKDLAGEWSPLLAIAAPVVLGHLGMMLMAIVDTLMVGPLGSAAVGAVGVGSSVLGVAYLLGIGLLLGIDRQVAVAHGAGRTEDIARAHAHGIGIALASSLPLVAVPHLAARNLDRLGVAPELIPASSSWLRTASWSLVPALVFLAVRQSLQALGDTRAATAILLVANAVNLFFNSALIHGRYGFPALGVTGTAWATTVARCFTAVALLAWSAKHGPDLSRMERRVHWPTLRELLRLGVPSAVQLVFEGGVFSFVTLLCSRFGADSAAAHQVVLQVASFTFMIPLGVGSAGSVRVGNALGREDLPAARRAGWSAVTLGVGFMACSGVGMFLGTRLIVRLFDLEPGAALIAHSLLLCAAFFQLFDGFQVTLSGVLRGSGDTVASMATNLVGHWFIGLPVGYTLGFVLHMGAVGLWMGLATGLGTVAATLLVVWTRRIGKIARGEIRAVPAEAH